MRKIILLLAAVIMAASSALAQVGTFSAPIDSMEFAPNETIKGTHLERVNSTDNYVVSYYDAATDGWVATFSCTATGDVGSVIDSFEFAPDVTVSGLSAEWADGYIALAYVENNVGKVATVSVSDAGAVGDAITSSYTYLASAASSCPNIRRVSGTNLYGLIYGTTTGIWVKSLTITSGVIAVVDSVRLTGTSATGTYMDVFQLAGSNYFVGGGKVNHFTFELNTTTGAIGAAAVDSIYIGYTAGGHRTMYYTVNDSLVKPNRMYLGCLAGESNNYIINLIFPVDYSTGDIMSSIDKLDPVYVAAYESAAGFFIGEFYFLQLARARTLQIAQLNRADGLVKDTFTASKKYGSGTTSSYADMIQLSRVDSTYYVLIGSAAESSDGWLHTYSVKGGELFAGKPGEIKPAIIDSLRLCINSGTVRSMFRVDTVGTIWAMFYSDASGDEMLKTFDCSLSGDLGSVIDSIAILTGTNFLGGTAECSGGEVIGMVYETSGPLIYISSVVVNPSTGVLADTKAAIRLAGSNVISPIIYRVRSSNIFAVIYGNDEAADVGWLKTYAINQSTGEITGGGGSNTLKAIDSLRVCVSNFNSYYGFSRISNTDYYALVGIGNSANRWTLRTVDINSTTGEIGDAWVDSLVFSETPTGSETYRNSINRMGSTDNYLVGITTQSGPSFYTIEILSDGTIADAWTDSFLDSEEEPTISGSCPAINVGGDIYAFYGAGANTDGYWYTFEADDTTGTFIPSSTNSFLDAAETNYVILSSYPRTHVISKTIGSPDYQNAYVLYSDISGTALYAKTLKILGEPDSYGWSHRIWGITPAKIFGVSGSSVSTVFGH